MTSLTRQIVLLFGVAASTGALAQTPRPPLGPGDVSRQFPLGLQQQAPAVASDSITVTNLGDSPGMGRSGSHSRFLPVKLSLYPARNAETRSQSPSTMAQLTAP
jgi:hypothetical protein